MRVVNALYVDSAPIADFLSTVLHMPAYNATIAVSLTNQSGLRQFAWSWMVPGGAESHLVGGDVVGPATPTSWNDRLVWIVHGKVSFWDQAAVANKYRGQQDAAYGQLRPPMLYAPTAPYYAGAATLYDSLDITGHLYRFDDEFCKHPIDPYP